MNKYRSAISRRWGLLVILISLFGFFLHFSILNAMLSPQQESIQFIDSSESIDTFDSDLHEDDLTHMRIGYSHILFVHSAHEWHIYFASQSADLQLLTPPPETV